VAGIEEEVVELCKDSEWSLSSSGKCLYGINKCRCWSCERFQRQRCALLCHYIKFCDEDTMILGARRVSVSFLAKKSRGIIFWTANDLKPVVLTNKEKC